MSDMQTIVTDIKDEVQKMGEAHGATIDAHKHECTETFKKAAEATAEVMQKLQDLSGEKKELEKQVENLEKLIARGGIEKMDAKNDPIMTEYYKVMDEELRKGVLSSVLTRRGNVDPALMQDVFKSISTRHHLNLKTVQESIDPAGGFFVHPEFLSQRVIRIFQTSPIRQFANIINTNTNRVALVIDDNDGATSNWVAEATAINTNEATPQIGQLEILVHKLKVAQRVTLEMVQDSSIDITRWIVDKTTARQAREQNTAYMAGDGNGKPRGILDYPAWAVNDTYERDALEHRNSGANGQFTYDGLTTLQGILIPEYTTDARWMINRLNWSDILQIKDTQDRPLYVMNNLLQTGATMVLLGKPVVFAEDVTASNQVDASTSNIIYGDFNGYTILDRMGITVFVDNITQQASDEIIYYVTSRTGGALTSYESLKVGDNTA